MIEVQSPNPYLHLDNQLVRIFLGGSIEMGKAVEWQAALTQALADRDGILLNPRRSDWDSSWEQSIDCEPFNQQVTWELDAIEAADIVIFYFDPATKSPITLMELGLVAISSHCKTVVCCPDGFWRKGNVDIVCNRYRIPVVNSYELLLEKVKELTII